MPDLSDLFGGVPFDPATVEPQGDFQVLPPGKYPVLIEGAEVRVTKKQTGHYIYLKMKILDGPGVGRYFFDQINIQNPSTECVEIGLRTLSALGRAIGTGPITDTNQLLNQVVIAHVKVKDEQNSVRTYSATGQPAQQPQQVASVAPTQAPAPVPVAPVAPAPTVAPVAPVYQPPIAGAPIAPTPVAAPVAPGAATVPPWQR